jgi:splicing factor 45
LDYTDNEDQFAPPSAYSFVPPPIHSPPRDPIPVEKASSYVKSPTKPPRPPPPQDLALPAPPELIPAGAIARAPVRYNLPAAPSDIPTSEEELERALAEESYGDGEVPGEDEPRSLRPGQKGFAERLMSKYGWSEGKGLGSDGSGIVNPLRVQIEKRKKKSDAEGGGFRDPPGGRGKIIGGKKNIPNKDSEVGKFGPMSEVIVLRGMVDGMDLDEEVEGAGDGGLMQEIGDECAEKVFETATTDYHFTHTHDSMAALNVFISTDMAQGMQRFS